MAKPVSEFMNLRKAAQWLDVSEDDLREVFRLGYMPSFQRDGELMTHLGPLWVYERRVALGRLPAPRRLGKQSAKLKAQKLELYERRQRHYLEVGEALRARHSGDELKLYDALYSHQLGRARVSLPGFAPTLDLRFKALIDFASRPVDTSFSEAICAWQMAALTEGRRMEDRATRMQIMALLCDPEVASGYFAHRTQGVNDHLRASMLGVAADDFEAWLSGSSLDLDPARLALSAQLLYAIESCDQYSDLLGWFFNPLPELAGRSLIQVMDSEDSRTSLLVAALCYHDASPANSLGVMNNLMVVPRDAEADGHLFENREHPGAVVTLRPPSA